MDQQHSHPPRPAGEPASNQASQPAWGPPPSAPPPSAPPPMPQRPGHVTASAVILIVLGVIVALFGILALLAGALFPTVADSPEFREQFRDPPSGVGGLMVTFGIIVLAYGALQVMAGIFVLSGRTWARITGLVLAVLGILFSLVGVLPAQGSGGANVVFWVLLLAYGFVAWVLASRGAWFTR